MTDRRPDVSALLDSADLPFPQALAPRAAGLALRIAAGEEERILAAGDVLGPYQIVAVLGAGGQGTVYRARHRHLGREVALKTPRREIASRLLREAKLAASLEHPRIARVEHIELEGSMPYMVIELCEQGSLEDLLRAYPRGLPLDRAAEVARAVLDALAYAHARGVVHCDLKPANVLFDRTGAAKLADFGVGRAAAEERALSHTVSGGSLLTGFGGTPGFMAPEQQDPALLAGGALDGRADLFAFGKLLFRMLTGARADTVRPPSRLRPELDARWDDVVFKLLEERREDRYTTAGDVIVAIRMLVENPVPPLERVPAKPALPATIPPVWPVSRTLFGGVVQIGDAVLRRDVITLGEARYSIRCDHFWSRHTLVDGRGRRLAVARFRCMKWGFDIVLRRRGRFELATDISGAKLLRSGRAALLQVGKYRIQMLRFNGAAAEGAADPVILAFLYYLYRLI